MELAVQAKFLRVLENQEFTKLGDTKPTKVNVRLVAATNRNLRQEAAEGRFRPDLYYRLSVFELAVPPLSARPTTWPRWLSTSCRCLRPSYASACPASSPKPWPQLARYAWPGNVRELKNVLERAAILAFDNQLLTSDDLPPELQYLPAPQPADPTDRSLRAVEARHLAQVLRETSGNKMEAARQLGIGVKTLYRKIEEYGLGGNG